MHVFTCMQLCSVWVYVPACHAVRAWVCVHVHMHVCICSCALSAHPTLCVHMLNARTFGSATRACTVLCVRVPYSVFLYMRSAVPCVPGAVTLGCPGAIRVQVGREVGVLTPDGAAG